jgi:hypothetical protein
MVRIDPAGHDGLMAERTRSRRRTLLHVGGVLLAVFVGMQLIPYGRSHSNPPVLADAPWPDAEAEAIARRSCSDCHSNETEWPASSYVAPMSWLVQRDVDRGRAEMNLSEWDPSDNEADDAIEQVEEGSMPPRQYTVIHRDAALSAEERQILIDAFAQMSSDGSSGRDRGRGDDDDDDRVDD